MQRESQRLKCSTVARELATSPIGTAGTYDEILVVEHSLPWPADALELGSLAPLAEWLRSPAADGLARRVQLTHPTSNSSSEVALYRRDADTRMYVRYSQVGSPARVAETSIALMESRPNEQRGPRFTEVFVCTHGRRDRCCGSLGPRLIASLGELSPFADKDVRVRNTSHLGGHRFAPTALIMPLGTTWAWLTAELLHGIVSETAAPDEAVPHFRGSMGIQSPEAQAVDAALFVAHGWDWFRTHRAGTLVARSKSGAEVKFEHRDARGAWLTTATVTEASSIPVPTCGEGIAENAKHQAQFEVRSLETVAADTPGSGPHK